MIKKKVRGILSLLYDKRARTNDCCPSSIFEQFQKLDLNECSELRT